MPADIFHIALIIFRERGKGKRLSMSILVFIFFLLTIACWFSALSHAQEEGAPYDYPDVSP